jgi:hypothetical protein
VSTNQTALAAGPEAQNTFRPQLLSNSTDALASVSHTRELAVWLDALRSFFDLRNHPLDESELAGVHARDFADEARVVQQALRRCLLVGLCAAPDAERAEAEEGAAVLLDALEDSAPSDRPTRASHAELLRVLSDLCALCDELVGAGRVGLSAWVGFGEVAGRELARAAEGAGLAPESARTLLARTRPELLGLAERVAPDDLAADVLAAFALLALALEELSVVESLLTRDHPLKHTLPVFTLLREQARELGRLIESRAMRSAAGREIYESLDGTAYALQMELNKVFGRELPGLVASRQAPTIYGKVESSCGLLRDCYQQTMIVLARLFEPDFEGALLFASLRSKHERSIRLRRDLWLLLELVRRAERERDRRPLAPLIERLKAFQEGSMRSLMFRDWESYERFVAEVTAARGAVELGPVLHRFATYLEALFTQISMRAVLADEPFDFPPVED